jgi:two-component system, chemotaxis family, response regulator Rcp1
MMHKGILNAIEILLVEDSPADVLITCEALQQARLMNKINVVKDGVEAIAYLRKEGDYSMALTPDLILLDINLPKKNGFEVLEEIKEDASLKLIPVVVLTTSKSDEDILSAYGLHANCYVVKPVDFQNFIQAVQSIEQFWFSVVTLPSEKSLSN